jgi:hypothetical protein
MSLMPDFIPIEMEGMSVITALCLFFIVVGEIILFKQVFCMCSEHDKTIENVKSDLIEMKIDVAETNISVKGYLYINDHIITS